MKKYVLAFLFIFISINAFSQIKIFNLNTFMRPSALFSDEQEDRAIEITNFIIKEKFDIIFFQESFDKAINNKIIENLGYKYQLLPKNNFELINNGLVILSNHEIEFSDIIFFKDCSGFDCLSAKGAVIIQVTINNSTFQFINTHLQADYKNFQIRISQLNEIKKLMDKYYDHSISQILIGDLNETPLRLNMFESMLNASVVDNCGLSWGCKDNIFTKLNSSEQLLDHILIRNCKSYITKDILEVNYSDHYPLIINIY